MERRLGVIGRMGRFCQVEIEQLGTIMERQQDIAWLHVTMKRLLSMRIVKCPRTTMTTHATPCA